MRIITEKRLLAAIAKHPNAKASIQQWITVVKAAHWTSIQDVRAVFPKADPVGKIVIFNINGNHLRLICAIHYNAQRIFILEVLTHAEYDKDVWKIRLGIYD
jgi:mRNA interferase HigB